MGAAILKKARRDIMNPNKEHTGVGKVKEYMPGTREYEETFGYGAPERTMAKIPGTTEYYETSQGRDVDRMPRAEETIASKIPGTQTHMRATGDRRSFTTAIKDKMASAWMGAKETMHMGRPSTTTTSGGMMSGRTGMGGTGMGGTGMGGTGMGTTGMGTTGMGTSGYTEHKR